MHRHQQRNFLSITVKLWCSRIGDNINIDKISAAASNLSAAVSSTEQIQIQRQSSFALTQRSRRQDLFSVTISFNRQRRNALCYSIFPAQASTFGTLPGPAFQQRSAPLRRDICNIDVTINVNDDKRRRKRGATATHQ
jgi:hypothetical protein